MKKLIISLFTLSIVANSSLFAVRKEIVWCVGAQTDCIGGNVSIGSANDKLSLNDNNIFVQNLGTIKTTSYAEISLPLSGQKIVAFTPTEKNYDNQQIKLLLYAFDIKAMPKQLSNQKIYEEASGIQAKNPEIKTMLKLYYKLPKQDQWTELLTSFNENPITAIKPSITVDSAAKVFYNPQKYTDEKGNVQSAKPIPFDINSMS